MNHTTIRTVPTEIVGKYSIEKYAGGSYHVLIYTTDKKLLAFGRNSVRNSIFLKFIDSGEILVMEQQ